MRKIVHIDMDAFFAAVEQRNHPEYKGKPLVVGGRPDSRGVVSTCSYEARKFGIHSAMPSALAYKLCPHAIFVCDHNFSDYKEVSEQIREIFYQYTDLVEPLSLDEAYLDVTENKMNNRSATLIAQEIRAKIKEKTKLTASAGVSYNKFIAKIASDYRKPDGITVVTPAEAVDFISRLPIRKFWGVGKVTEKRMISLGIKTGADLQNYELYELIELFGKSGPYFFDAARGIDNRAVEPSHIRKSIGRETTLKTDITDKEEIYSILQEIAEDIEKTMERYKALASTVTLKVKFHDFQSVTRSFTSDSPLNKSEEMMNHIWNLISKTEAGSKPLRLLGISLSGLSGNGFAEYDPQLKLPFEESLDKDF
ncbi:MAG: DNA polymerase IV [Spirochaetaceae bacterium]|nr:DNA polymerase IV [Spirochaetaceae bacterium]